MYALTLKIQGISFLLAWMTSDSRTELAENSSSLLRIESQAQYIEIFHDIFDLNIWASHLNEHLAHLMSMTWLTMTPGWAPFPSPSSYRKSLKSQTTAQTLCQPLFTPVGFGTWKRQLNLHFKAAKKNLWLIVYRQTNNNGKGSMCLIQMTINKDSIANSEEYMKSRTNLTLRCPSYAVPMPLWASIPNLPFVWSGATGHTEGALSAQVTWQEKLQTIRRDGEHRHWVLQSILSIRHPGIGAHLINQCERKGSPLFYSKLEWLFLQWNIKGTILKDYTGYPYAFLWRYKVVRVWTSQKLKM